MRIPRQVDGSRTTTQGIDGLRARRQHLVGQLRTVAYWQRLVQARTDLLVAGLLYGAPVPVVDPPEGLVEHDEHHVHDVPEDHVRPADLHQLAPPPEGLDVDLLVGGPQRGLGGGTGAHLDRLRSVAAMLTAHRRGLDDELDAVTLALHDRLAADGWDGGDGGDTAGASAGLAADLTVG